MENSINTQAGRNDASQGTETLNLRHYWHVILERRWLVITAFVSVFVLCLIYLFKATPIYEAASRLQIDREQENVLNVRDGFSMDSREQDYLQTQYKNLASRSLIESVISRLQLDKDPRYSQQRDYARAVMRDVTIAPIRLSRLVDIKVQHPDPQKAKAIANSLVQIFIERNMAQKRGKMRDALGFMRQEAEVLEKDVYRDDMEVQNYVSANNMVSLEDSQNIVQQGLKHAKDMLDQVSSRAVSADNLVESVDRMLATGTSPEAIPAVLQSPLVSELKKNYSIQQAALEGMLQSRGNRHPEVVGARKLISTLELQVRAESKKVIDALRNEAQLTRSQQENLRIELATKEKEALELGKLRVNFDVLRRKAEKSTAFFTFMLQRIQETDIVGKDKTQNMRVVDEAFAPYQPVKPRWSLTLLLGVVGGLVVACALAFFVNYLDDSIKSQDDVETYLRLQFLGYVPNIKTNSVIERDLQAHLHPQSSAAEGFRTIRATLSLSRGSDKHHILSVTSTIPSEGKSLVASNIAIVSAQTGLKTLLVDADLRRPSVHKAFQLQSPIGLSAYLSEKVSRIDEIVHTTEVPKLDVVCCGAVPSSPSELIGSKRMIQFLAEARQHYDRVVLDCPPVSAVSDPLVVAAMSDGVVFVTKFNKIRREHARKSIQRIHDAGIRLLGVVLNDIDFEGKDSYYYSYYYYQNRYYASHYKTESVAKPADAPVQVPTKKA